MLAGNGRNLVLGDNGRYTARTDTSVRWGQLPLSAGRLETTDPTVGGNDTITTGSGIDVVLAGQGDDLVRLGGGADIALGDHGFVDWVLLDGDATDLDRIWSADPELGGDDDVTTGEGDDVVIGG